MALHQRPGKNMHMDTVIYEIDMLRHCGEAEKRGAAGDTASDHERAEYNLAIEGFLLHLRNLLAFLTNRKSKSTDLIINEPETWAGRHVDQQEYSGLIKGGKKLDRKYGVLPDGRQSTCYDEISKYLQHCTTLRQKRGKRWPVGDIYAEISPLLQEFKDRFAPDATSIRAIEGELTDTAGSTASFRTLSSLGNENG